MLLSTEGLRKASARKVYGVVYGVMAAGHFVALPNCLRASGSLRESLGGTHTFVSATTDARKLRNTTFYLYWSPLHLTPVIYIS